MAPRRTIAELSRPLPESGEVSHNRAPVSITILGTYLGNHLTIVCGREILKEMPNRPVESNRVFHALADPSRRSIVERLVRGPASVSQLAEPLDMSLAAVVQHLSVLEDAGIVASRKIGRVRTCRLEPAGLRRAEDWLVAQRTEWELRLDRLGDVLASPDNNG